MERYESYKDSGVEWLGEIPVGWEIKKLKYGVSKVGSGVTPSGGASIYQLSGIPLLRSQNIHVDGIKMDDVAYIDEKLHDSMSNSKVQAGDVLLNITGASIGRCFYVEDDFGEANVNQHVCIIRPNGKIKTSYLYFVLRSDLGEEQIKIEQTGSGREGLNFEALNNFIIPYLSAEEQTSIANFLDRKTTEIDALIAQKERLLELYEEEKTAIINHAVTKGLDLNKELKDSGVEWLDKIQVSWKIKKLKYIANLKSGNNLTSDQIKEDGPYPVYGGNGLRGYHHDFTHEGNFILIGRQGALCGNINYANNKFWATEHAVVVEPLLDYRPIWMGEVLRMMNLNQYSVAAAQPGLSVEMITNLFVPWPSLEEQIFIEDYIKTETDRIDSKIAKTQRIIELQKEYRSALISEVVTGKIKVIHTNEEETTE